MKDEIVCSRIVMTFRERHRIFLTLIFPYSANQIHDLMHSLAFSLLMLRHRINLMHGGTFFLHDFRLTPTGKKIPLRVFMSNGSGYYLDFNIYREVTDPRTGQVLIALTESHIFPDAKVIRLTHFVCSSDCL